jgi:hypothetical protein
MDALVAHDPMTVHVPYGAGDVWKNTNPWLGIP